MEVGCARHRNGEGAKRGDLTGRNPTDRGKRGVKRHILTDAHGVPLAAIITGANVFDGKMLEATLDATVLRGPRGPRRPQHLCLERHTTCLEVFWSHADRVEHPDMTQLAPRAEGVDGFRGYREVCGDFPYTQ